MNRRRQLFEQLKRKNVERRGTDPGIERLGQTRAPLSYPQQRLWFLDQFEPGSPRFSMLSGIRFTGGLRAVALQGSLDEIVRRHEALRTRFIFAEGGGPEQIIDPPYRVTMPIVDLSRLTAGEGRDALVGALLNGDALRPFDLAGGRLMRCLLLRLGASEHIFGLTMHQIISDRWSRGLFVKEMVALYAAHAEGRPSPLPELPIQYADFAAWQRRTLTEEKLAPSLDYWRQHLRDLPVLPWPVDRPRPEVAGYRGAMHYAVIPRPLLDALEALSRERGATLFMTLMAALSVLAWRQSGETDIILGSPVANRKPPEIEPLMGFFLNMIALRLRLGRRQSFVELVAAAREVAIEAFSHQNLPFEVLVERLVEGQDLSRHPIFQVAMVLQNTPMPAVEMEGVEVSLIELDWGATAYDLAFFFWETALWEHLAEGLSLTVTYSTELFDTTTIQRLSRQLANLLQGAVETPDRPVEELPMLAPPELQQVLREWGGSVLPAETETAGETGETAGPSLPVLFEAAATARPEALAFVAGEDHRSYGELRRRARALARQLRRRGVGPEVRVGVGLAPGFERLLALVSITLAGGAWVPLDPLSAEEGELPEPIAHMLRAAGAAMLFAPAGVPLPEDLAGLSTETSIAPGGIAPGEDAAGGEVPGGEGGELPAPAPESLACVLFTSGSSGRPKGVALTHGALVDLVRGGPRPGHHLVAGERLSQLAHPAFDAANFEIWAPLLGGGVLVQGPGADTLFAADALAAWRRLHRVRVQFLTSALFHRLAEQDPASFGDLDRLLFGGETARADLARTVAAACPGTEVIHAYGPAEATTFAALHRVGVSPWPAVLAIGRPLPGGRLVLADPGLRPVPAGGVGEICLAGPGLARGYLGDPRETARLFVPDPYGDPGDPDRDSGGRLYRSGDLGRFLPDGQLLFCGRIDAQLKVRGFRIEPGEIETLLEEHPAVARAAVVLAGGPPGRGTGTESLIACVTLREGPAAVNTAAVNAAAANMADGLRTFLRRRLSAYRVPARVVIFEDFPLTSTGKVDRRALAARAAVGSRTDRERTPARTPREATLARAFGRVLNLDEVGIHDDFFELGGHSLAAAELIWNLRREGLPLDVRTLFERPTVAALAEGLASEGETFSL